MKKADKVAAFITADTSGQESSKDIIPEDTYAHMSGKYVGVMYLLNYGEISWGFIVENHGLGGAFGNGHAAVIIIQENGYGDFYSFAGIPKGISGYLDVAIGNDVRGSLSTSVDEEGVPISIKIRRFLELGGIHTDYTVRYKELKEKKQDERKLKGYQREKLDPYSHGIYIPINDAQGKAMKQKADEIRKELSPDEGSANYKYNLYAFNCSMVAQTIMWADGKGVEPFGPTSADAADEKEVIKEIQEDPYIQQFIKLKKCGITYLNPAEIKRVVKFIQEEYKQRKLDGTIPNAVYDKGVEKAKTMEDSGTPWYYGTFEELKEHFEEYPGYEYYGGDFAFI